MVVGFAPIMFGGNRPVLWAINAIGAGVALMLTGIALTTRHGRQIEISLKILRPAFLAWLVLVLWIVFQLIPGRGWGHPTWQLAAEALGESLTGPSSVDPLATKLALLRLLIVSAVFLAVFSLAR